MQWTNNGGRLDGKGGKLISSLHAARQVPVDLFHVVSPWYYHGTSGFISDRQCTWAVKARFYPHWLSKYPLVMWTSPTISAFDKPASLTLELTQFTSVTIFPDLSRDTVRLKSVKCYLADENSTLFPRYLRYSHKYGIIVFSILSAITWA